MPCAAFGSCDWNPDFQLKFMGILPFTSREQDCTLQTERPFLVMDARYNKPPPMPSASCNGQSLNSSILNTKRPPSSSFMETQQGCTVRVMLVVQAQAALRHPCAAAHHTPATLCPLSNNPPSCYIPKPHLKHCPSQREPHGAIPQHSLQLQWLDTDISGVLLHQQHSSAPSLCPATRRAPECPGSAWQCRTW